MGKSNKQEEFIIIQASNNHTYVFSRTQAVPVRRKGVETIVQAQDLLATDEFLDVVFADSLKYKLPELMVRWAKEDSKYYKKNMDILYREVNGTAVPVLSYSLFKGLEEDLIRNTSISSAQELDDVIAYQPSREQEQDEYLHDLRVQAEARVIEAIKDAHTQFETSGGIEELARVLSVQTETEIGSEKIRKRLRTMDIDSTVRGWLNDIRRIDTPEVYHVLAAYSPSFSKSTIDTPVLGLNRSYWEDLKTITLNSRFDEAWNKLYADNRVLLNRLRTKTGVERIKIEVDGHEELEKESKKVRKQIVADPDRIKRVDEFIDTLDAQAKTTYVGISSIEKSIAPPKKPDEWRSKVLTAQNLSGLRPAVGYFMASQIWKIIDLALIDYVKETSYKYISLDLYVRDTTKQLQMPGIVKEYKRTKYSIPMAVQEYMARTYPDLEAFTSTLETNTRLFKGTKDYEERTNYLQSEVDENKVSALIKKHAGSRHKVPIENIENEKIYSQIMEEIETLLDIDSFSDAIEKLRYYQTAVSSRVYRANHLVGILNENYEMINEALHPEDQTMEMLPRKTIPKLEEIRPWIQDNRPELLDWILTKEEYRSMRDELKKIGSDLNPLYEGVIDLSFKSLAELS